MRSTRAASWIIAALGWGLAYLVAASGCSSVKRAPQEHQGLFDDLSSRSRSLPKRELAASQDEVQSSQAALMPGVGVDHFSWPLRQVTITSEFGRRMKGRFHEGLDLRAPTGTPVFAAHAGRVIYAGDKIKGYGKLVVIKDKVGYSTIYAHNSRLIVRQGQWVKKGDRISLSGSTGTSFGPHLHFEIRKGQFARDPRLFLAIEAKTRVPATTKSARRHSSSRS